MRELLPQLVKYCLVGGFNTLLCLGLMAAGKLLGLHYAAYTVAGYMVAMVVSFGLNLTFTFRARGRDKVYNFAARFAVANLLNLAMVQGLQAGLIEGLGVPELAGVGVSMVVYTLVGFWFNRRFVFRAV